MSAPRSTPLHVPVTSWAPRAPTPHPCRWEHVEPLAHGRAHGSRHGERGGRTAVPLRVCKCACERGPRAAGGGPHGGDSPAPGCLLWPGPTVAEPGTGARSPALRSGAGGTLTRHRLGFPERDLHPAPALLRPRQTELGGPGWGRGGGMGTRTEQPAAPRQAAGVRGRRSVEMRTRMKGSAWWMWMSGTGWWLGCLAVVASQRWHRPGRVALGTALGCLG